jgi:hypothetical protein
MIKTETEMLIYYVVMFIVMFLGALVNPLVLFISSTAFILILRYIFRIKNYNPKIYYALVFFILVIQGLVFVYTYMFRAIYLPDLMSNFMFVGFIVLFIILVWVNIYYYCHWEDYSKLP